MAGLKHILFIGVVSFLIGILSSCSHFSFRSKESIDAEEKKPWVKDETTVEGVFHKSKQRLTPHIGFTVPLDSDSNSAKIPGNEKYSDEN